MGQGLITDYGVTQDSLKEYQDIVNSQEAFKQSIDNTALSASQAHVGTSVTESTGQSFVNSFSMGIDNQTTDRTATGLQKDNLVGTVLGFVGNMFAFGRAAKGIGSMSKIAINSLDEASKTKKALQWFTKSDGVKDALSNMEKESNRYKSWGSWINSNWSNRIKSLIGFEAINFAPVPFQDTYHIENGEEKTHNVMFDEKGNLDIKWDELASSMLVNHVFTTPVVALGLGANAVHTHKMIKQVAELQGGNKKVASAIDNKSMDELQTFMSEGHSVFGSKKDNNIPTDVKDRAIKAGKKADEKVEQITGEESNIANEIENGFDPSETTNLKKGEYKIERDYADDDWNVEKGVNHIGAYKNKEHKQDIIHNKLFDEEFNSKEPTDETLESISDVFKNADENVKQEYKDKIKKIQEDFKNEVAKNNGKPSQKNVDDYFNNINNLIKDIEKLEEDSVKNKQLLTTRMKINHKKHGYWELENNHKEAIEHFKNKRKKSISEALNNIDENTEDKTILENKFFKDYIESMTDKEKEAFFKNIKNEAYRKKIEEHMHKMVDNYHENFNSITTDYARNIGIFSTTINGKAMAIPHDFLGANNFLNQSEIVDNSNDEFLKKYTTALVLNANKIDNFENLNFNEINKAIQDIIDEPAKKAYMYHASEIINTNGESIENLTLEDAIGKEEVEKLKDKQRQALEDLIQSIKDEMKDLGISKEDFININNENFNKSNPLTYYKAILSMLKQLKDPKYIPEKGSFAEKINNIRNAFVNRLEAVKDISGSSFGNEKINQTYKKYVQSLENKVNEILSNTKGKNSNTIETLQKLFVIDKKTNRYVMREEFKALIYQSYIKTLSESITGFKLRKTYYEQENKTVIEVVPQNENLDVNNLVHKVVHKALSEVGMRSKTETFNQNVLIGDLSKELSYNNEGRQLTAEEMFGDNISLLRTFEGDSVGSYTIENDKQSVNRNVLNTIKTNPVQTDKNGKPITIKNGTIDLEPNDPTETSNVSVSGVTQSMHKVAHDKEKITLNGNEINRETLNKQTEEITKTIENHIEAYYDDHIPSGQMLEPNAPNPIDDDILNDVKKSDTFTDKMYKNIFINKSKALINESEKALALAMARNTIQFHDLSKNSEHRKIVDEIENKFNDIDSYMKKDKITKDDAQKMVDALKFMKLFEKGVVFDNKLYEVFKEKIKSLKENDDGSINKQDVYEISNELFGHNDVIKLENQLAMSRELKSEFDSMKKFAIEEDIDGFSAKLNNMFSGRMAGDGALSHQSGKLAKLFIRFDDRDSLVKLSGESYMFKSGFFIDNEEGKLFLMSAIKTIVDEIDGLELVPEELQNKFNIAPKGENPKNKIEKSNNGKIVKKDGSVKYNAKDYLEVVKYIVENLNEPRNIKDAIYLPKLKAIYKHFVAKKGQFRTFDATDIISEFDGNQNMVGIMNAIFGNQDKATGINGHIYESTKDHYEEFKDILTYASKDDPFFGSLMGLVNFSRSDAKKPTQAHDYGQGFMNTLRNTIEDGINKYIQKIKLGEFKDENGNQIKFTKENVINMIHKQFANEEIINSILAHNLQGTDINVNTMKNSMKKAVKDYVKKLYKYRATKTEFDINNLAQDDYLAFIYATKQIVEEASKNKALEIDENPALSGTYKTLQGLLQGLDFGSADLAKSLDADHIKQIKDQIVKTLQGSSNEKNLINELQSKMYVADNNEILLMKLKSSLTDLKANINMENPFIQTYINSLLLKEIKDTNNLSIEFSDNVNLVDIAKQRTNANLDTQQIQIEKVELDKIINNIYKQYNNGSYAKKLSETAVFNSSITKTAKDVLQNNKNFAQIEQFKQIMEKFYTLHAMNTHMELQARIKNPKKLFEKMKKEIKIDNPDALEKLDDFIENTTEITYDMFAKELSKLGINPFGSKTFIKESHISTVNTPFGRELLPFTYKATGYDEESGMQFNAATGINKALTYFIQSTESNILGLATQMALKNGEIRSITHRFDAQYGLQGMRVAQYQNKLYNAMYIDTDFFDYLSNETDRVINNLVKNMASDGVGSKESIREIARQLVIEQNGENLDKSVLKTMIDSKTDELIKLIDNQKKEKTKDKNGNISHQYKRNSLKNSIEAMKREKIEALSNIDENNIINEQFGNGLLSDKSNLKDLQQLVKDIRSGEGGFNYYTQLPRDFELTTGDLRNIDISMVNDGYRGMSSFFNSDYIDFYKLDNSFVDFANNRFGSEQLNDMLQIIVSKNQSKAEAGAIAGQVKLTIPKIETIDDLYEVIHELNHGLLHISNNDNLLNNFRTNLIDIGKNLLKNKDNLDIKIKLKGKEITLQDYVNFHDKKQLPDGIEQYDMEEFENTFIHVLLGGDFIKSNKKLLAFLMNGKKNSNKNVSIKGDIQKIYLTKDGDTIQEITTLKQLNKFVLDNHLSSNMNGINDVAVTAYGMLNTNEKLKSHILNEKVYQDGFGETYRLLMDRADFINQISAKASQKFIGSNGLFDLLQITSAHHALTQAIGLYNGAEKNLIREAHMTRDIIDSKLNEIDSTNKDALDEAMGIALTFGLHILNSDIIKASFGSAKLNIIARKLNEINTDWLLNQKVHNDGRYISKAEQIELKLTSLLDDLVNNSILTKEQRYEFEKHIESISYGNEGSIKKTIKFIKKNIDPKITDKNAKLFSQKLASLKILSSERGLKNKETMYYKKLNYLFGHMKDKNKIKKINDIFFAHSQTMNRFTTFGENVDLKFLKDGKTLYISEKRLNDNDQVATIYRGEKKYYVYTKYTYDTTLGKQDGLLMPFDMDEFEKGIFKKDYKGEDGETIHVSINPQNMKLKNGLFDNRISVQMQKNNYLRNKEFMSRDLLYRQFKLLRDNGILLTDKEMKERFKTDNENEAMYKKLDPKNPIAKAFGTGFNIKISLKHQLEGTEGFDLTDFFENFTNPQVSKAVAITIKSMLETIKKASSVMLLLPRYQFNSWLGSYTIYGMHGGFMSYVKYRNKAKTFMKAFRHHYNLKMEKIKEKQTVEYELSQNPNDKQLKAKLAQINKDLKTYDKNLEDTGILDAFQYGIGSTMKSDLIDISSEKELHSMNFLKEKFGEKSQFYHFAKWISFDPKHNKLGKAGWEIFEDTELVPKLALYYRMMEKYKMTPSESANYVSMAFPRYNNLNQPLAIANEVTPYVKFIVEFPRVMAVMGLKNPTKYLAGALIVNSLSMFGYNISENESEWESDHNIVKISKDYGINLNAFASNFELSAPFIMSGYDVGSWIGSVFEDPAKALIPMSYHK